jgi:hypothetical protein
MKYLFLLLTSLVLSSCSDEQIINPILLPLAEATIGVKSKIFYPSLESSQILSIEDYEYNTCGQLQKKIYHSENRKMISHYELFNYDNNGILIYKLNFHNNINSPTGFILLDSTIYLYSSNLLSTVIITHPNAQYDIIYTYEYDGIYLIKKTTYHNEGLESYITYEYKDGKIQKEINYYKDNSITESKEYKYKDVALVEIVYYTLRNEAKRRINFSYNKNGKLLIEKVDELFAYSSSLPYVVKYEY